MYSTYKNGVILKVCMGDFPGDPVDRIPHIHCRRQGSIPGLGARSSHGTTKEPTHLKEDSFEPAFHN